MRKVLLLEPMSLDGARTDLPLASSRIFESGVSVSATRYETETEKRGLQ